MRLAEPIYEFKDMAKKTPATRGKSKAGNRRKSPRIELRHKLSVRANGKELSLDTADFGFGGVFLETKQPLPVASELTVVLEHDGKIGETRARVIRQDDSGMAVAFIEPEEDFTKLLIAVVAPFLEQRTR